MKYLKKFNEEFDMGEPQGAAPKKVIEIKFPNGDIFQVPAEIIAKNRTEHYAESDSFKKGSSEWDNEFKQSMDSDELYDWIGNNMDWSDIKPYAIKIKNVKTFDYDSMWNEAEIEVK